MTLDPGSFHPPPKVRSAVMIFEPLQNSQYSCDQQILLELISTSFRMRRKKLVNNVENFRSLTREDVRAVMETANLEVGMRAEELSLAEFDAFCCAIKARLNWPSDES